MSCWYCRVKYCMHMTLNTGPPISTWIQSSDSSHENSIKAVANGHPRALETIQDMFGRFVWRGRFVSRRFNWTSQRHAASASGSVNNSKGMSPLVKAAITSATMSAAGDILAQGLTHYLGSPKDKPFQWQPDRTQRMLGFGLVFYGPYQHYWYNLLDWRFPKKIPQHFIAKVFLNQTVLAPVVLTVVFAWNLALTGQPEQIGSKIKRDLVPTMLNGWKFWIPAASANFYLVPLDKQVLFMSVCGIIWTAYLSFASNAQQPAPMASKTSHTA